MIAILLAGAIASAGPGAGPGSGGVLAVIDARIVTEGPAGTIERGTILVRGDRIAAVGAAVPIPPGAATIDAAGATVTPGLIVAGGVLGIVDLPGYGPLDDSATDSRLVGAAFEVASAVNPANPEIADARADGVLYARSAPHAGDGSAAAPRLFDGQDVVLTTAAVADPVVRHAAGVGATAGGAGAAKVGGGRGAQIALLREAFDLARASRSGSSRPSRADALGLGDPDLAVLRRVIDGAVPLEVTVDRASDIAELLRFAAEQRIGLVLVGAREGWLVAGRIAAARVPVILSPEAVVARGLEDVGTSQENAARLAAAGVRIAFSAAHERPDHYTRSPRLAVGRLVGRSGLPYDRAVAALTIDAARTLGIADRTGSIEPGKLADLVIWRGDPLADVDGPARVIAAGVDQSLETRGSLLGRRYLARWRAAGLIPAARPAPDRAGASTPAPDPAQRRGPPADE